jgi:hypothetical protein
MTIELVFGILASSSNPIPVWMQNHRIETLDCGIHGVQSSIAGELDGGICGKQGRSQRQGELDPGSLTTAGELDRAWQVDFGSHGHGGRSTPAARQQQGGASETAMGKLDPGHGEREGGVAMGE